MPGPATDFIFLQISKARQTEAAATAALRVHRAHIRTLITADLDAWADKLATDSECAAESNDWRSLYTVLRQRRAPKGRPHVTVEDENGELLVDPIAIEQRWRQCWANLLRGDVVSSATLFDGVVAATEGGTATKVELRGAVRCRHNEQQGDASTASVTAPQHLLTSPRLVTPTPGLAGHNQRLVAHVAAPPTLAELGWEAGVEPREVGRSVPLKLEHGVHCEVIHQIVHSLSCYKGIGPDRLNIGTVQAAGEPAAG